MFECEVKDVVEKKLCLDESVSIDVLTQSEKALIRDVQDLPIIAKLKMMGPDELRYFDSFEPKDFYHYISLQKDWLKTEAYLLGTRLKKNPSSNELFSDTKSTNLAERFRAFYVMKFPDRVNQRTS